VEIAGAQGSRTRRSRGAGHVRPEEAGPELARITLNFIAKTPA
jgi:hypothetical protein